MGIYFPARVEFSVSEDGKNFHLLATVKPSVAPQEPGPLRQTIKSEKLDARARYVRIRAVNLGVIPAGQPAAGGKPWLFVDEIMVNPEKPN
jgi:hexosaminidase